MGIKFRYCTLLIFVCCFSAPATFCQVIENRFTHYTTKDGLPDGQINEIKQDKEGFLWIATHNGLCRFDGHTFKTFRNNTQDTNSLCENGIYIFIDPQNRLWAVSANWLYLYHRDGEWFEHFSIDKSDGQRICAEENGQLIIATSSKGLYQFDIARKKLHLFVQPGLPYSLCYYYLKDDEGVEWIGTRKGLIRYDPKTQQQLIIDPHGGNVLPLPNDLLLSGTFDQGLLLINRKTNTFKRFLPDKKNANSITNASVYTFCQLKDSIILIGTGNGLSVFNWRTETFTSIVHEEANPASLAEDNVSINIIFLDREGIIWLGGLHLEKYDFRNFNIKTMHAHGKELTGKPFLPFDNILLRQDGKFLLGGYYGLGIYDPATGLLLKSDDKKFKPLLKNKYRLVDCIQEDAPGNTWCYNEPDFCSFQIKNNHAVNAHEYHFPFSLRLGDMKLDKKGRVLIGTEKSGLIRFDPTDSSYTFYDNTPRSPAVLSDLRIRAICVANDGSIWLGGQKGLSKIEKDGVTVKQFNKDKHHNGPLHDFEVTDIAEDSHGITWVATKEQGIGRIGPATDSIAFLSVEQGLPTCWYSKLCVDEQDNLWALSKMGILRINTVTLQNQLYTENEGFPLPDDLKDIHYSRFNKRLYILTNYAIFETDPQGNNYKPKIPQTVLTGFSIFDKERPLNTSGTVNLKYNENFINIQFAALLFHSNEQIKYAFKMEGVDKDWVYCNFKRNANYTNLPPGHYVFKVKAESPEGVWKDKPTELSIFIKPPYWQTWWFYTLEGIAALATGFWIIRLYTSRKLAKQRIEFEKQQAVSLERTRIAADMHDELGAGLTSIRFLSEIANEKIANDKTAKTEIEKIEHSAARLSENLREIIWTMNTRFDKLDDFIIYVRTYAVEYFDDTTIRFHFISPDTLPTISLKGELRRNLFLCVKEALHNILKHSSASEASVTFHLAGDILSVIIKDNGKGIETGGLNKFGNGLNTMADRLQKIGSELEIEVKEGTKISFKFVLF